MAPSRGLEEIVDQQVRRWELERRLAAPRTGLPCIAISRLPGSGAAEIGQRVAKALDYGFFGVEILERIARQQGIQRRLLAGLDEHVRSLIERHLSDAFGSRAFTESDYLRHVIRTIATLGERGMAVILGRGSPFILSPDRALRVLVVAPGAVRLEQLAKARHLPLEEAAPLLAQEEAARHEFHRHHFGVNPDEPTHYDLVVNKGTLGTAVATALVVDTLRSRFPSAGAGTPS
jgi:cytidylate kinase